MTACLIAAWVAAAGAQDAPVPRAFAWLGSWEALEGPRFEAPSEDGTVEGELGDVFGVAWTREANTLRAKVTTLKEAWCGRLGIEVPFAEGVDAIAVGMNDLPVRVPLTVEKTGQIWWTWEVGVPRWLLGGTEAVIVKTRDTHGCFMIRDEDGSGMVHLCLDRPEVGGSVEIELEMVEATADGDASWKLAVQEGGQPQARMPAPRDGGFVRVDEEGWGFELEDGTPFHAMGKNLAHMETLTPAEQDELLDRVVAAKMNTIRLMLPDCTYRPVPGVWNDEAIVRLRETIARCAERGIRVVVCLQYSAAAHQYNNSIHITPAWGDLYLLDETMEWYAEIVERIVVPLKDDPTILAWDITNEPLLEPDARSKVLPEAFREWTGDPDAELPTKDEFEKCSTPEARAFWDFAPGLLAKGLIRQGKMVRAADPNHLITVSHGAPRFFRGLEGADVFDFWAPHTYDLWVNGAQIDEHVALLVHSLRWALPDKPRPVLIEEFGMRISDRHAAEDCAEHISQFIAGGKRHGLAGLLHWWDMAPEMDEAYAEAGTDYGAAQESRRHGTEDGPKRLAVYLPPSQEWKLVVYDQYMTRRAWGKALAQAHDAGWEIRSVGEPREADGADALLVLGDEMTEEELGVVKAMGLPVWGGAERRN